MIELTYFKSAYDNVTNDQKSFNDYDSFLTYLKDLYSRRALKPRKGEITQVDVHAPLISPAIYKSGTTRSKDNVEYWGAWASLDIDDGSDFKKLLTSSRFRLTIYNTASSREDFPKFRIITPLKRRIEASEFKKFWYAYHKLFGEHGDPQTKDISRMFYVPGQYPDAYSFFHDNKLNDFICPSELMTKYPRPPSLDKLDIPESMEREIQALKRKRLTKVYKWTSYKDCPFVNSSLVMDYFTSTSGWYGKLYSLMLSIASNAIRMGYPISVDEIVQLIREIDIDDGNWYSDRPLDIEAQRALQYAMENA